MSLLPGLTGAQTPPLQSAIEAALRTPTLAGAHVGVLALDTASGAVLYARNPDDDFIPASTLKLLVGSVALARLGPEFSFRTDVATSGSIAGGTLAGNLYLRGGGDAQLSVEDLDTAAAAVAATGVRQVSGALIGDASRYAAPRYPGGWEVDDLPYEYAAVPSALSVGLNVAHVRVVAGNVAGAPTSLQIRPQSTALTIENQSVTGAAGSPDTTDLARPWDRPRIVDVTGSYPAGAPPSDDLEPAVADPATFAVDLFKQALSAHGVSVTGGTALGVTPPNARVVWSHRSKPLRALLHDFWPPSINLIGEQLLLELGATAPPENAASQSLDTRGRGLQVERAWLPSIGVDAHTVTLADGSGLSDYDRVSPRTLTEILQADWHGPQREAVLSALPVAGASGTLASRFTQAPLRGAVYAKTGSTNHARLLAGYARTPDGRWITFALMINDWMDDSPRAEHALDAARSAILMALVSR
jgi:D-alanyl-D-alanine carboxypeptidase/D-alanyl-D-alanine-endopeptidase (penicillin-binding protein 4)